MSSKPRLDKAMLSRRRHPIQQFGQGDDESTWNGATGCTHTTLQNLALLWKGRMYSHDQISMVVGYPFRPASRRGLRPSEVETFCRYAGLPYKVCWGMTAMEVLRKSNAGPVGFGHVYGWTPEWTGYRYNGIKADGRPNGFAHPSGDAGKTQLTGFERGAHMSLLLGYLPNDTFTYAVYVHEPNHGSASRPERPYYDWYSKDQFLRMYDSYHKVLGRTPYALVPTKGL